MIEVYSWGVANGHAVHLMREECGLPFRTVPLDIGVRGHFRSDFLASPNRSAPWATDPRIRDAVGTLSRASAPGRGSSTG